MELIEDCVLHIEPGYNCVSQYYYLHAQYGLAILPELRRLDSVCMYVCMYVCIGT
jgi:hypothetical protein